MTKMSDTRKTDGGVYIKVGEDKKGREHINIYSKDPQDPEHVSIHINIDPKSGSGNITDTTSGSKETTDTQCYLTTACMRHFDENFDDAGYELTTLRWFRDTFVSKEDIEHYYKMAPYIVDGINSDPNSDIIYNYIYENVIDACVKAIEIGDYEFAYNRYKNSILVFEEEYAKKPVYKRLAEVLKKSLVRN